MLNMFAVLGAGQPEFDAVYSSSMVSDANRRWADLYWNLANWTGQERSFKHFQDADYIYDTFVHQKMLIKTFEFPSWATSAVRDELKEMHRIKFAIFTANDRIKRLTMGVFLAEITGKIRKALMATPKRDHYEDTDDTGQVAKMNIYMTHDIFLFNLLVDLGIANTEIPPFGSAIIFELHQVNESSMVRIRFLNENLSMNYREFKANPLRLAKYADLDRNDYTVNEFLYSFSDLLMSEAEADRACRRNTDSPVGNHSVAYISVIVIESIIVLLFVVLSIKKCLTR